MQGGGEVQVRLRGFWTNLHPCLTLHLGCCIRAMVSWFGKGSLSRPGAEEEPSWKCLPAPLPSPGGGALGEGWLGATWREFITTSEIFPALMYSRLFVYPPLGGLGKAGGWRDTINGNVPKVQISGGVLKKGLHLLHQGFPTSQIDCISFFFMGKHSVELIWFISGFIPFSYNIWAPFWISLCWEGCWLGSPEFHCECNTFLYYFFNFLFLFLCFVQCFTFVYSGLA